jgi:hypothetical protein
MIGSALAVQDAWVFDLSNDFKIFKNKLSVEFINWRNFLPLVWRINVIDLETNADISLILEIDSIEIFVIERSLISSVSNRKNTRKQKIKAMRCLKIISTIFYTRRTRIKQFN